MDITPEAPNHFPLHGLNYCSMPIDSISNPTDSTGPITAPLDFYLYDISNVTKLALLHSLPVNSPPCGSFGFSMVTRPPGMYAITIEEHNSILNAVVFLWDGVTIYISTGGGGSTNNQEEEED